MSIDPNLSPLTETVTIETDAFGLVASCWNGPHRVVLARTFGVGAPVLKLEGGPLRETLPGVRADDVLDLLAAGRCGDFAVEVHAVRHKPVNFGRSALESQEDDARRVVRAARRDVDFGGSF